MSIRGRGITLAQDPFKRGGHLVELPQIGRFIAFAQRRGERLPSALSNVRRRAQRIAVGPAL